MRPFNMIMKLPCIPTYTCIYITAIRFFLMQQLNLKLVDDGPYWTKNVTQIVPLLNFKIRKKPYSQDGLLSWMYHVLSLNYRWIEYIRRNIFLKKAIYIHKRNMLLWGGACQGTISIWRRNVEDLKCVLRTLRKLAS